MAADDEVLEDEPPAWSGELVGADGMAARRDHPVGEETEEAERPELHLLDVAVRERLAGMADGEYGQDLRGQADQRKDPQGAAQGDQAGDRRVRSDRYRPH